MSLEVTSTIIESNSEQRVSVVGSRCLPRGRPLSPGSKEQRVEVMGYGDTVVVSTTPSS